MHRTAGAQQADKTHSSQSARLPGADASMLQIKYFSAYHSSASAEDPQTRLPGQVPSPPTSVDASGRRRTALPSSDVPQPWWSASRAGFGRRRQRFPLLDQARRRRWPGVSAALCLEGPRGARSGGPGTTWTMTTRTEEGVRPSAAQEAQSLNSRARLSFRRCHR